MRNPKEVEFKIFPRIFALAEVAWTDYKKKNYFEFLERVKSFVRWLKFFDINFCTDSL